MAEIALGDLEAVAQFLEKTFKVETGLAKEYAKIAVFLSDHKSFSSGLKQVDQWLAEIFKKAMSQDVFAQPAGEEAAQTPKKAYNVTSRLLNAAANSVGWHTGGNLVMSGYTHSPDFVEIVRKKLMWKDSVASGHGEFTHIIQWLVIYTLMFDRAPALFSTACDYSCEGGEYNKGRKAYLWDFVVDCFPAPPETDWRVEPRSGTARSPTIANAAIFKTEFLGARLNDRYERRNWVRPSDSQAGYTGTSERSHGKHLDPDSTPPLKLEDPHARDDRAVFEGQKGYKGLLTTGYPKPNTEKKVGRSGYLFARSDATLKQGSTLTQIAQQVRL